MATAHDVTPIPHVGGDMPHNPLVGLRHFLRQLLQHKWIVVLCLLASGGLGAAYFATATRKYSSQAELYIVDSGGALLNEERGSKQSLTDSMPTYERVLQSKVVLKNTLERLPKKHLIDFLEKPKNEWPQELLKNLSISQVRRTNVLQLQYTSSDPDTAAVVVEALIASYLEFMKTTQQDSAHNRLQLLTVEKQSLESQIREKEAYHLRLRSNADVLFGEGDKNVNVVNERVIELNKSWITARKETIDSHTFLISVNQAIMRGEDIQQFALQLSSQLGEEILKRQIGVNNDDSWAVSQAQQQLVKDQSDLENKLTSYGPNHPEIKKIQQRIDTTNKWLSERHEKSLLAINTINNAELAPRLKEMATHRYQQAYYNEQVIYRQFMEEKQRAVGLNQQLAELENLSIDIKRMRTYYDLLVERIKDIDLSKQNNLQISISGQPTVNPLPVSPKLSITIIFSIFAGFSIACAIVYIRDVFDDRFRTAEDLQGQLNIPILAMIRQFETNELPGLPGVNTFHSPNSIESESFRTLRTKIEFTGENIQRISISSTEPSDGKTTVISNLAVAFAQSGKRTLIIDGDMRRPGLSKHFAYRGHKGLSSILRDKRSFDECFPENILTTEMEMLDVMPSGPRPMNPVELLGDPRMSELLAWAESRYDRILIDAPPALAVADPAVIGRLVDGSILTVRPDRNRKYMVKRAAESLCSLGANILGLVVNQLPPNSDEYGYGYGYGYGYSYGHDHQGHDHGHDHHGHHEHDHHEHHSENEQVEQQSVYQYQSQQETLNAYKNILRDEQPETSASPAAAAEHDFSKPMSVAEYEDYYRKMANDQRHVA